MRDPNILQLDQYSITRRTWIQDQQRRADLKKIADRHTAELTTLEIGGIVLGIVATVILLVLFACASPPPPPHVVRCLAPMGGVFQRPVVREEATSYVLHVDDMTDGVFPKADCTVVS